MNPLSLFQASDWLRDITWLGEWIRSGSGADREWKFLSFDSNSTFRASVMLSCAKMK